MADVETSSQYVPNARDSDAVREAPPQAVRESTPQAVRENTPQGAPSPTKSLQHVPPQSIDAEVCVLGSMILHSPCIDVVVQILRIDQFYRPAHQLIFQALIEMKDGRREIDLVTLKNELTRRKQMEQIGGLDYLVQIVEGVPNAANAEYYARIVRDKAMLRELIVAGTDIVRDAYDSREEPADIVEQAEQRIFEVASARIGDEAVSLKGLLEQTFEQLQEHDGQLITGLSSGYHQLDELTAGFQNSEMIVIAARPSMGKTSLLLNIAEYMAVHDSRPLAFYSLEMSKQQIAQRLLGSHSRFDLRQMRRGRISPEGWTKLQLAAGDLEQAPILIDDSPELTILQLRAKSRRLKAAHDIQCVFVDYMQLMSHHGRADSRQQEISEISRGLKALGRELDIPVIVAAQLNRGPADREGHRPRMSDLRESGSIEQDADVVALLHCEDYYHRGQPDYVPTNITELIVAKQRNGPTGSIRMTFLPHCTRFESAASESFTPESFAP
ncbi:MAG: replicative DNA helicase [Planctomycetota bacterium]|jgi:replicative DNA helicase